MSVLILAESESLSAIRVHHLAPSNQIIPIMQVHPLLLSDLILTYGKLKMEWKGGPLV